MPIYDYDGTTKSEISKLFDWDGTTANRISKVYDFNGTNNNLILANDGVYMKDGVSNIGTPSMTMYTQESQYALASYSYTLYPQTNGYAQIKTWGAPLPYLVMTYPDALDITDMTKITATFDAPSVGQAYYFILSIVNSSGTTLKTTQKGNGSQAYSALSKTSLTLNISGVTTSPVYLQIGLKMLYHAYLGSYNGTWRIYSVLGSA